MLTEVLSASISLGYPLIFVLVQDPYTAVLYTIIYFIEKFGIINE